MLEGNKDVLSQSLEEVGGEFVGSKGWIDQIIDVQNDLMNWACELGEKIVGDEAKENFCESTMSANDNNLKWLYDRGMTKEHPLKEGVRVYVRGDASGDDKLNVKQTEDLVKVIKYYIRRCKEVGVCGKIERGFLGFPKRFDKGDFKVDLTETFIRNGKTSKGMISALEKDRLAKKEKPSSGNGDGPNKGESEFKLSPGLLMGLAIVGTLIYQPDFLKNLTGNGRKKLR